MSGLTLLGKQLSRYSAIGVLNTLVGGLLIFVCHKALGFGIVSSNIIGYGAGLLLSYFGNRYWTFDNAKSSAVGPLVFAGLVLFAFLTNLGITYGLMGGGLSYNLAQISGIVSYSAIIFLGMKFVLFTDRNG